MGFKIASYEITFAFNKRIFLVTIFLAVCAFAASVYLYFHSPFKSSIFPACAIRTYLHIYCPGCGATRATYELLHGNLALAFRYNPLYIISIPYVLYLFIQLLKVTVNGKALLPEFKFGVRDAIILSIIIFGFWILRNVSVYPFTLLAPNV